MCRVMMRNLRTAVVMIVATLTLSVMSFAAPAEATYRPVVPRRALICRAADVRSFSPKQVNCGGRTLVPARGFIFVRDADGSVYMVVDLQMVLWGMAPAGMCGCQYPVTYWLWVAY